MVAVNGTRLHAATGATATVTLTSIDGPTRIFTATVHVSVQTISALELQMQDVGATGTFTVTVSKKGGGEGE